MSTKTLRKELLAAIAMVIVAAIALSGSTYAWFAANNQVTANQMTVQAVAEAGIEIVAKGNTDWSTTDASNVTSAMALYPTSTRDGATWVHASAAKADKFTAAAGTYEILSLTAGDTSKNAAGYATETKQIASQNYDATGKQYYRIDTFQIRTVQGTTTEQKVKVKEVQLSGTPQSLDKSLRVLIKSGSNYYNYNAGAGSESRVVATAVNGSKNPETIATVTYLANNAASELLCTCAAGTASAAGTPQDVDIYVYYEGEDVDHYSNNLENALAQLSVTVIFEADNEVVNMTAKPAATAASAEQQAGTAALN